MRFEHVFPIFCPLTKKTNMVILSSIVVVLLVSAGVAAFLGLLAARHREVSWTSPFIVLASAVAFWAVGYALELWVPTLESKILTAKFQYIGIATVPLFWLVVALRFAGLDQWTTPGRLLILGIIPASAVILAFTNEWHYQFWQTLVLDDSGLFPLLDLTYGWTWYIFFAFSYILLLSGTIVLLGAIWRFHASYRLRFLLLLLSPLLPWVGNALYVSGNSPLPNVDFSPIAFSASIVIFGFGVFRFRLFDIVPVARSLVVENLHEAILVIDNDLRLVDINRAGADLFAEAGGNRLLGQTIERISADWPQLAGELGQLHKESSAAVNTRLSRPVDGRIFSLVISDLKRSRDRRYGYVIFLRDITNDVRAEEVVAMAVAKSELLAKVGHELRTPINGVLGMAEMLEYGTFGQLPEEQRDVVFGIIDRTQHLSYLVNDILAINRLEEGEFPIQVAPLAPADLGQRIVDAVVMEAGRRGLDLHLIIDPDLPPTVMSDGNRLFQIGQNLVENALKFTLDGSVTLTLRRAGSLRWAIEVSDTGVGISAGEQAQIFEAFQQANFTIARQTDGVGLGLTIVKQLTQKLGGEIRLESEPGQGSRFTVLLPLTLDEPINRADEATSPRPAEIS